MVSRVAALIVGLGVVAADLTAGATHDQTRIAGPQRRPQGAVVIGTIIDASTGLGVARAIVRVRGGNVAQTRVTDEKGRYYFTGLPQGDFQLTATRSGFFDGEYGRLRAGGDGLPLSVTQGQWITDARVDVWRPAVIHGVVVDEANEPIIGVRVLAHRRTFVDNRERLIASGSELTDDEGAYRLSGLMPGDYFVSVPFTQVSVPTDALERIAQTGSTTGAANPLALLMNLGGMSPSTLGRVALTADGSAAMLTGRNATPPPADVHGDYAYPRQFYPAAPVTAQAIAVTVRAAEERGGVTFQLRPVLTRRISGHVSHETGPVANHLLRLLNQDAETGDLGSEVAVTMSRVDGTFTFVDVPPGRYVVDARESKFLVAATPAVQMRDMPEVLALVNPPGGGTQESPIAPRDQPGPAPDLQGFWGRTAVDVFDRHVTNAHVVLQRGIQVRGSLVFDGLGTKAIGLTALSVLLDPISDPTAQVPVGRMNAAGGFSFDGVMPGTYAVRLATPVRGWTVVSITANGRDVMDGGLVASTPDEVVRVVITLATRGAQLKGFVRDATGRPAKGATVVVLSATPGSPGAFRVRSVRAPMWGPFTIDALRAGEYFVVAMDEATAEGWQTPERIRDLRARAMRIVLRETEVRLLDLVLR